MYLPFSALSASLSLATQVAHTNCVIVVMFEFEVNRCLSLYKTLFSFSFRKSTSMRAKRVHQSERVARGRRRSGKKNMFPLFPNPTCLGQRSMNPRQFSYTLTRLSVQSKNRGHVNTVQHQRDAPILRSVFEAKNNSTQLLILLYNIFISTQFLFQYCTHSIHPGSAIIMWVVF